MRFGCQPVCEVVNIFREPITLLKLILRWSVAYFNQPMFVRVSGFCPSTSFIFAASIPAGVSGFFIDIKSFRSHYGPGVDSASNRNEYVPGIFPGGKGGRCLRLTTYHHPVPLSWNLGNLTSCNPLGLSRPVMGLLYVLLRLYCFFLRYGFCVVYLVFCFCVSALSLCFTFLFELSL